MVVQGGLCFNLIALEARAQLACGAKRSAAHEVFQSRFFGENSGFLVPESISLTPRLQPRINWLTFQSKDGKNTFVDIP